MCRQTKPSLSNDQKDGFVKVEEILELRGIEGAIVDVFSRRVLDRVICKYLMILVEGFELWVNTSMHSVARCEYYGSLIAPS